MSSPILKHLAAILIFSIIYYVAMNFQQFWGPIKHRGFHCNDLSIRQPYVSNTVGKCALYTIGVGVPVMVMILVEFLQLQFNNQDQPKRFLPTICCRLYANLIPFLYGFAIERLLKNVGKHTVTRLRPFFYEGCRPVLLGLDACGISGYIEEYTCSSHFATDSLFKSFPSGHSSLSFYGMVFLALYLQRYSRGCLKNANSFGLILPLMQLLCVVVALCVAVSRIFDYKHFATDVVAGSIFGSSVAVVVTLYRNTYMVVNERIEEKKSEKAQLEVEPQLEDNSTKTSCIIKM